MFNIRYGSMIWSKRLQIHRETNYLDNFPLVIFLPISEGQSQAASFTRFSSEIGTKLRDWAVGQAGGS